MAKSHQLPVSGITSAGDVVAIREGRQGILTQLAGWSRFEDAADAALRPLSLSLPRDYRTPTCAGPNTVLRIAPDRALVRSEDRLSLESSDDLTVLDLSDARLCLVLEGPGAVDLLSRVMALDFSETAFPVGTFAQGALDHVGVLVDRRAADQFDLLIPTTWAASLAGLMADHLRQAA